MRVQRDLYCLHCGQPVPVAGVIPPQCPICLKEAEAAGQGKARGTWWTTMPRGAAAEDPAAFDRRFLKRLRIAPG